MSPESNITREMTDKQLATFAKFFLPVWMEGGFGTLTKRDTESLIFACLRYNLQGESFSNYEWARRLRITPSKVQTLRMNAHMKYGHLFKENTDLLVRDYFSEIVEFQVHKDENGNVTGVVKLQVEDRVVRMELEETARILRLAIDFERNRNIIKMDLVTFLLMVDHLTGGGEEETIRKLAAQELNTKRKLGKAISEIEGIEYAERTETEKLKEFGDVLHEVAGKKVSSLLKHLGLIFKSQKHHRKENE